MSARLVIIKPLALRGTSFTLTGERTVVGRGAGSDVRLDDSFISQSHAVVLRQGQRVLVEDLGSKNGTSVNGGTVSAPRPLRHGDVIGFGRIEVRYEEVSAHERGYGTRQFDPVRDAVPEPAGAAHFAVDRQQAHMLSNVGRDQYVHQQVIHQRDSFLRDIAATKTKATRLIWTGVVLMLLGIGAFASMVLGLMSKVSAGFSEPTPPDLTNPLGPALGGVPIGLIGWAVSAIGTLLIIIGIVLHIVATARRRRVYASFPPPWAYQARHP
jgi:FHA domain